MQTSTTPSLITRVTVALIVAVQVALGLIFILSPATFSSALGLPPAPAWTDWMFAMLGARAFGFAYGMLIALRDVRRHASWFTAMIVVQAIDWIATIVALQEGKVTLQQVSSAAFLPVLFVAVLAAELLRQRNAADGQQAR